MLGVSMKRFCDISFWILMPLFYVVMIALIMDHKFKNRDMQLCLQYSKDYFKCVNELDGTSFFHEIFK